MICGQLKILKSYSQLLCNLAKEVICKLIFKPLLIQTDIEAPTKVSFDRIIVTYIIKHLTHYKLLLIVPSSHQLLDLLFPWKLTKIRRNVLGSSVIQKWNYQLFKDFMFITFFQLPDETFCPLNTFSIII